jgi:hypothetical protein
MQEQRKAVGLQPPQMQTEIAQAIQSRQRAHSSLCQQQQQQQTLNILSA